MGIMMIAGTERRRQGCSLQDGKQWGINTGGAVRTSTLPIPFTNVFLAVASTSSEWCCPGCSATNTTVTTRAYQSNRPDVAQPNDVNWIIIGCQPQWGYLQQQAEKWIYPIPVLEAFIATKTCISNNHSAAGYVGYWTWDKDITTEYAYSWNNYPSYCFMIGKVQQQWGYQKQLTVEPVVYPLPVNTVCCVWAHSIHDRQDPGTYHSILSKITPVGVQILAGQYNAPATAYSGVSAYWGMIGC